jgi:hypothetical protein
MGSQMRGDLMQPIPMLSVRLECAKYPIERIVNIRRRLEPAIFEEGKRKASRVEVITI